MVLQSEDFQKFPIFDTFLKPHFDVSHMGREQGTGNRFCPNHLSWGQEMAKLNEMVQYVLLWRFPYAKSTYQYISWYLHRFTLVNAKGLFQCQNMGFIWLHLSLMAFTLFPCPP